MFTYTDIFGDFLDKTNSLLLKYTTKLSEIKDPELMLILKEAYSSDNVDGRLLATLLNSIFTQKSMTFVLSQRGFIKLLKEDTNGRGDKISGSKYIDFKSKLHQSQYIETLREPTNRKGGVYKLIHPNTVEILNKKCSRDFFKAQEDKVLAYYDTGLSYAKKTNKTKKTTATEKWKKVKEELRNKKDE
ncbi:MAG TPA: hypothetical protein VI911_12070 [Patescibacteria group bacterium]|nr:hypothetical protein [Patescibacteria group bacterium]